jgi:ABC-2 type transport system ATP-binding protein
MVRSADQLALDLKHVAKNFGSVKALRGIGMQVHAGEVFGLLGPNGAGKTTLVKILMTVIRPTRAEGLLLGRPIGHKPTLAQVGYLPESHRFPPYLTGRQVLEYYAALAKVDRDTRRRRSAELLELVGMREHANRRIRTYSKGMQQRIGLAQALMNDPKLVVLDEPTDGLDPVGRRDTREMLQRLRDQRKTVFLNSHLLGEVERVCDRVAILSEGKVVRQGTLDELTGQGRYFEVRVTGVGPEIVETIRGAVPEAIKFSAIVVAAAVNGGRTPGDAAGCALRVESEQAADVQPVIDALRGQGVIIESIQLVRQSLEDFFIRLLTRIRG